MKGLMFLNKRKKVNKLFFGLTVSISMLALMACSDEPNPPPPMQAAPMQEQPVNKESEAKETKITINGESPEVYYSHFLFHHSPICTNAWHQYAGTFPFDLGQDELGRKFTGDIEVLMLKNGTYFGAYIETTLGEKTDFGYPVLNKENRQFKGRWRIEGPDIVFDNLGKGFAMLVNKKRTIQLRVDRDILSVGLAGQVVEISIINSNTLHVPEQNRCVH